MTSNKNFSINNPVIHEKHGIGIYKGLIKLKIYGIKSEYLIILYANNDKLYVPISSLHLVQNYVSNNFNKIILNKLGHKNWNNITKKISKKIYDTASILLKNYAVRTFKKNFSYTINKKKYKKFCKNFPFKFTYDQKITIKKIFKDMLNQTSMDRLICGDVGFGKTEVAMHAAFLASSNNKQVVILVPTTLLAEQHYKSFLKRFSKFFIKISILSRFSTKKNKKKILKNVKNGKINILIGTHSLLFNKLKWKNLSLLIIDEEHRFGVMHKEKIKSYFNHIDVLTLTATPIPRTLNISFLGIRSLSIISTPPKKKFFIKTFVKKYNVNIIRNAILKEINRFGQVFYILNKIKKIDKKLKQLKKLVPEGKFYAAHGKMKKKKLKKIIKNFYKNKFNILLCTTIIETGIDIPRANTILIEDADNFGLSQLHQLRGRVGRSNKQAYAWLFISKKKKLNILSKKRLDIISSKKNFESGFELSKRDLEFRGMGDILGKNQSGHLENINIEYYTKLLKKAIFNIKTGNKLNFKNLIFKKPVIDLNISYLIPEKYIFDVNIRLNFYKKITSSNTIEKLKNIQSKLLQKFGTFPKEVKILFLIEKIKIISQSINIKSLKLNNLFGEIKFLDFKIFNFKKLFLIFNKNFDSWKIKKKKIKIKKKKKFNSLEKAKWIFQLVLKIQKIKK